MDGRESRLSDEVPADQRASSMQWKGKQCDADSVSTTSSHPPSQGSQYERSTRYEPRQQNGARATSHSPNTYLHGGATIGGSRRPTAELQAEERIAELKGRRYTAELERSGSEKLCPISQASPKDAVDSFPKYELVEPTNPEYEACLPRSYSWGLGTQLESRRLRASGQSQRSTSKPDDSTKVQRDDPLTEEQATPDPVLSNDIVLIHSQTS